MRYYSLFRCSLLVLLISTTLQGQNNKALLHELMEENKKSVEALALYPTETRLAILEASQYPEVLIKMNGTRQKTAAAFRTLIEDFPRETQQIFYDMTRYPGVVQELAGNRGSAEAMRETLKRMPEKQRDEAFDIAKNNEPTVLKINELVQTSRSAFEDLIAAYPAKAQGAFRQLVELPEVLEILNEDLRLTVLIGDIYRDDPAWVIRETDSLNVVVAQTHADELAEWKKSIESDPEAQKELQEASREYAEEMGYSDSEDYSGDDVYYDNGEGAQAPAYDYSFDYYYPWWFGYPWWYPAPCWRPYPWWYDWGFYYYPYFSIVYMPSWYFMDWYYYYPYHHHHYEHLSSHFVEHYYGHRNSGTSISTSTGRWRDQNRAVVSDEWVKDKARLPERMKEYGKFEEERQKYNARNPKSPVTQDAYLEKNTRKYPELAQTRAQAQQEMQREAQQTKPSAWAPRKDPAPVVTKTEPAQKPKAERPPRQEIPPVQQVPKEKTQRPDAQKQQPAPRKQQPGEGAKDYHRQKWNEAERRQAPRQPAPSAAPRSQPSPQPAPAPRAPSGGGRKN